MKQKYSVGSEIYENTLLHFHTKVITLAPKHENRVYLNGCILMVEVYTSLGSHAYLNPMLYTTWIKQYVRPGGDNQMPDDDKYLLPR